MKKLLLAFLLLTLGCTDSKEEKIENIKLDAKLAKELVSLSLMWFSNLHHVKQLNKSFGFDCSNLYIDTNSNEEKETNRRDQLEEDNSDISGYDGSTLNEDV